MQTVQQDIKVILLVDPFGGSFAGAGIDELVVGSIIVLFARVANPAPGRKPLLGNDV